MTQPPPLQYAGFWLRVAASIIDTLLLVVVTAPLLFGLYGWDAFTDAPSDRPFPGLGSLLFNYIFPVVAVLAFWFYKSATPGKMAFNLIIVDARTGGKPTAGQFILRYLGYFISFIPLGLGILWIAFDKKKQGWHDKIAGTIVVKKSLEFMPPAPAPDQSQADPQ